MEHIVFKRLITNYVIIVLQSVKHVLILTQLLVVNAIQDLIYIILLVLQNALMIVPIKILLIILVLLFVPVIKKMDIVLLPVQLIIIFMKLRNNVMNLVVQKELITKLIHIIAMLVLLDVLLVLMEHQINA